MNPAQMARSSATVRLGARNYVSGIATYLPVTTTPSPLWGEIKGRAGFHGFRCASPVAAVQGPSGAKTRDENWVRHVWRTRS
jgi:hypothetical protein